MNKQTQDLAKQAGFDLDRLPDDVLLPLQKYTELLAQHCTDAVKNTPTHCASTTFQMSIVECTIHKSVDVVETFFKG